MTWMTSKAGDIIEMPKATFEKIFEEIDNGKNIAELEKVFTGRITDRVGRNNGFISAIHNRIRKCMKIVEIVERFENIYGEIPANAGDIENGIEQSRIFIKHHAAMFDLYLGMRRRGK